MDREERDYLEQRAEEELECAQSARHPAAVKAHYLLLGHYLDRIYSADAELQRHAGFA